MPYMRFDNTKYWYDQAEYPMAGTTVNEETGKGFTVWFTRVGYGRILHKNDNYRREVGMESTTWCMEFFRPDPHITENYFNRTIRELLDTS